MSGLEARIVVDPRSVDVALSVGADECVALIGPNGAGKSTVVDVLAGLVRPDGGSVVVDGRTLAGDGRAVPTHRRRTGLVAQRPDLFPHRSVLANVAFGPRAAGASGREARGRAREALAAVGAVALADRAPGTLSGGQAQRVAIARALATDPAVLLLDEPTSALDVTARQEVRAALAAASAGRPTLLVSHDPVEVAALADRVVVLEAGRVVEQGTPAEVLGRPRSAFAARFSGLVTVSGTATTGGVVTAEGGELSAAAHTVPPGRAALAAYHPTAACLTRDDDGAGRRVDAVEPRDGLVRVRAGELVADVTLTRFAALGLAIGDTCRISVPADEVVVYEPGGGRIGG
ncbi:molybdate transport system ATP-binding protein [Curtobacterium luteum]|uniref:Molybdate transport system ATP-binding protein n=1 Tax=Curtobacterium luteum TaxID=33881 RepID=A0A7Y6BA99_9MICO|nr:ABC transporter ATP-binding protein [Curtobacterium luteum]MBM7802538.1 molybdate transport system ATP-binding protein [Curtobacterium luteum]NUU50337.1 ABC transporter ATP-binding protein [Curtobacterium luteum]NUU50346.1 ABC transporter ATP-binding protein [Curtobacterium luteum]GGL07041.1 molybdenum ABC transporter ATP-binding protein [Curtobacterium luteum]